MGLKANSFRLAMNRPRGLPRMYGSLSGCKQISLALFLKIQLVSRFRPRCGIKMTPLLGGPIK